MRQIQLILLVVLLLSLNGVVQAAAVWVDPSQVSRYYPQTNTFIATVGAMSNPAGCASASYYGLDSTHPQYEEYQRVLLTALASGKNVRVMLDSDPGDCVGSYPKIYKLYIDR